MSIEEGKIYVIENAKSGTVLDLSWDDGSVHGWSRHDGDNQKWALERDDNQWVFKNVGSGKYLALDGDAGDNTTVHGADDPFAWDINHDEDDESVYRIFVPGTPFNVDLSDHGNPDDGTPVAVWGKWEGTNQTWRFHEVGEVEGGENSEEDKEEDDE